MATTEQGLRTALQQARALASMQRRNQASSPENANYWGEEAAATERTITALERDLAEATAPLSS